MYITELPNGKFKFSESYFDPIKNKYREKSVTLPTNTRKTRNQAQEILDKKIQDYLDTIFQTSNTLNLTFKEITIKYYDYKKKQNLKVNSIKTLKYRLNLLSNTFGDKTIKEIHYSEINNFLYDLSNKISTAYVIRAELINIIKFSGLFGYTNIEYPIDKIIPLIKKNKSSTFNKYLTKEEVNKLLSAIEHEVQLNIVKCMLTSGMRYNELLALTLQDINFVNKEVTISKTIIAQTNQVNTPKNGKTRVIDVNDEFMNAINSQLHYNDKHYLKHAKGYLFLNNRNHLYSLYNMNAALKKYESIVGKKMTTHIFRHTFITRMVEQQVPMMIIAEYVGHTGTKMIEEIYSHFSDELKRQSKDIVNKIKLIPT